MEKFGLSYQDILKFELEQRKRVNKNYSLRAFARDLEIDASRLAAVLKNRQGLSKEYAEKISKQLSFSEEERDYFCDQVESQHGRSKLKKRLAVVRLENKYGNKRFQSISLDHHSLISDWYHFAILELTRVEGFKSEPGWIAQSLDVDLNSIEIAINRLKELSFLGVDQNGNYFDNYENVATPTDVPSRAIRNFHGQILDKAKESLNKKPVNERDMSNLILSISKDDLAEAKGLIKKFRREFSQLLTKEKKDSVYTLEISFFELTNLRENL